MASSTAAQHRSPSVASCRVAEAMPRSSSASPTLAIRVIDARWAPLLSEIEALGDDHDIDANEQAIAMLTQWVDLAVEALATTPAPAASPRSVNGRREPERPAHAAANSLAKHIHEASAAIEARSALAPAANDAGSMSFFLVGSSKFHETKRMYNNDVGIICQENGVLMLCSCINNVFFIMLC